MRFISRRILIGTSSLFLMGLLAEGCKKKEEGRLTPLDPPTLEFIGAENTAGEKFESTDKHLQVGCDMQLIIHLGPSDGSPGTIANWSLRPPHVCGGLQQCGYVRVEALNEEGEVLYVADRAEASPLLMFSGMDLVEIASLRATLFDGETLEPFLIDEQPVSASWETSVSKECGGLGGAGGGPGDPEDPEEPDDPEDPGDGGAGGFMGE